jgi:taurine dioxygenase
MPFTLTPLSRHTGAEIGGIDLRDPVDEETRAALNRALADWGVLVFRDQQLTPEQYIASLDLFGEMMLHHDKRYLLPENPLIYQITNQELEQKPGTYYVPGTGWHTDHSNDVRPPKATMLYAVKLPDRGGDTQYANVQAAFADLPADLRERITGRSALHVYQSRFSQRQLPPISGDMQRELPPGVRQPLVRINPDNNRPGIYVNPIRIEAVDGMDERETLALVEALLAHATQPKYEYRHRWKLGDVVIWDNRSVLHQANADYDMRQKRLMYRLMVRGEEPIAA